MDIKFHGAIRRIILFPEGHFKHDKCMQKFKSQENIEPHSIYPTSIYPRVHGCIVATADSQEVEAVVPTILSASIHISKHALGFNNPLLAEI